MILEIEKHKEMDIKIYKKFLWLPEKHCGINGGFEKRWMEIAYIESVYEKSRWFDYKFTTKEKYLEYKKGEK